MIITLSPKILSVFFYCSIKKSARLSAFVWTLRGVRVSGDTGSGLKFIGLDWRSNFNNYF